MLTQPADRREDTVVGLCYGYSVALNTTRHGLLPLEEGRNSLSVNEAAYNLRSSTRRVPEHRMILNDVCDHQFPARSTFGGR